MPSAVSRLALLLTVALMSGLTVGGASAQSPSLAVSPTTGPSFDQVVSDDGLLTLTVPFGVDADVATLSIVSLPAQAPAVAAYELRPVGTTLSVPVTASWQLDPAGFPPATDGDLVWLGMASTDDPLDGPWSWLDDPRVSVVGGSYAVTGLLTRLGTLIVTRLPTFVRGPEAMWGTGYAPGRGIPIDMDLTLVTAADAPSTATFSVDWAFGDGYPDRISVMRTVSEVDHLAAVWECQRVGGTSLVTMFGVREAATEPRPAVRPPGLGQAAAAFSVTFPVACGTVHPGPDPNG